MMNVDMLCHYAECHDDECRHAECCYAECHNAECRYAECRSAEKVVSRSNSNFQSGEKNKKQRNG